MGMRSESSVRKDKITPAYGRVPLILPKEYLGSRRLQTINPEGPHYFESSADVVTTNGCLQLVVPRLSGGSWLEPLFEQVRVVNRLTLRIRRDPQSREVPFLSGVEAMLLHDPGFSMASSQSR